MKSLSSVGLGLSVVFGCLFLALIAELYYLLWWKKRLTNRDNNIEDDEYTNPSKEVFYMFCWRRTTTSKSLMAQSPQQLQLQMHTTSSLEEDELDAELMRLQSAYGPPRHLFTIVEETKEDLESEDGKSRCSKKGSRGKSLSDLLETPYLTPLGSPTLFTPPLTPLDQKHNFSFSSSPLFESKSDAEFNKIRSSPPPKFKFLQEAEEKLRVKLREEAEAQKGIENVDQDGSFITIIVDKKNKQSELNHHLHQTQHEAL